MSGRDEQFRIGEVLPGTEWVVQGVLGRGGMGVVLDVHKDPGIRAAIKVLLPRYARDTKFVDRFLHEVRVLATLRHPNIVQVQDRGQLADGTPYLVMERLEGRTVRAIVREREKFGRRMPAHQVLDMARDVSEGLHRAHTSTPPVVHRDLKPDNIFLHQPPFGQATFKVLDFGIAELLGSGISSSERVGTPRYMSPEALRGEPVDARCDVYSLALIVYELLAQQSPWENVDYNKIDEVLAAHLVTPPPPPSRFAPWVPKSVDRCLLQALAKERSERQESVMAFGRGLAELRSVDDGASLLSEDVNTTVPTLSTLALGEGSTLGSSEDSLDGDTERTASRAETIQVDFGAETARQGRSHTAHAAAASEDSGPPQNTTGEGGASRSDEVSIEVVSAVARARAPKGGQLRWARFAGTVGLAVSIVGGLGAGLRARALKAAGAHAAAALASGREPATDLATTTAAASKGAAPPREQGLPSAAAPRSAGLGSDTQAISEGEAGVRVDAERENLGVAPLPSRQRVAEVLASATPPPPPSKTERTTSARPAAAQTKAAPSARAAFVRNDGLELLTQAAASARLPSPARDDGLELLTQPAPSVRPAPAVQK